MTYKKELKLEKRLRPLKLYRPKLGSEKNEQDNPASRFNFKVEFKKWKMITDGVMVVIETSNHFI